MIEGYEISMTHKKTIRAEIRALLQDLANCNTDWRIGAIDETCTAYTSSSNNVRILIQYDSFTSAFYSSFRAHKPNADKELITSCMVSVPGIDAYGKTFDGHLYMTSEEIALLKETLRDRKANIEERERQEQLKKDLLTLELLRRIGYK